VTLACFWDILNVPWDLLVGSATHTDLRAKRGKEDKCRKARKRIIFTIMHVDGCQVTQANCCWKGGVVMLAAGPNEHQRHTPSGLRILHSRALVDDCSRNTTQPCGLHSADRLSMASKL